VTPTAFIAKWRINARNERAAAQEHFLDLCALLDEPTPNSDPTGAAYAFEKGATKASGGEGWADVWRRGRFAWEYKGKHKDLDAAHRQLLQYAGALENPPLLVTSDIERITIRTNWTNAVSERHEVRLEEMADPVRLGVLKSVFADPERLRPGKTRAALTAQAAAEFAELAGQLRTRGNAPQAVAHFVNRLVFCLFADDVGLLPAGLLERMLDASRKRPAQFEGYARRLFAAMAERGGEVDFTPVAWFNGGLFDDAAALPLEAGDIALLQRVSALDWAEVDPSILGTLFERGLDPDKRSQLGAHYTSREMIERLIEPVVRRPLLIEWGEVCEQIAAALAAGAAAKAGSKAKREAPRRAETLFRGFLDRLRAFRVLDPACGSGNFLYLALLALKDLEHQAMVEAEAIGLQREFPQVGPEAVLGLEVNPYAAELARVSVWIGHIQWARRHGFPAPSDPVLRTLDTITCQDAVLADDGSQAAWPTADVIVGNPPFLGDKAMIAALGQDYVRRLRTAYAGSVPGGADLVCYWFERARTQIADGCTIRAGLVATNSIRGGANRRVLERMIETGRITNAWPDNPWALDGAAVRVSLVCFDSSTVGTATLDGLCVPVINADLTAGADLTRAHGLLENEGVAFSGITKKGAFDFPGDTARSWLRLPTNPNGRPNADVLAPWMNGEDVTGRPRDMWIINFGDMLEAEAAYYAAPFSYVSAHVKPERMTSSSAMERRDWWKLARRAPAMFTALKVQQRFIVTPEVSKHRVFIWCSTGVTPDKNLVVIARSDETSFGVLHSRFHEVWALRMGTSLEDRPRYTVSTTLRTFPFPDGLTPDRSPSEYASDPRAIAIAQAAQNLAMARERWLNPAELVLTVPEVVPGFPDRLVPTDDTAAKTLRGRTLTALYNQRGKSEGAWLDALHRALDEAVAAAYGWPVNLSDDEILTRLLAVNQSRARA
jgi:type II restriction/modification system DNA methylase subunit YeeA